MKISHDLSTIYGQEVSNEVWELELNLKSWSVSGVLINLHDVPSSLDDGLEYYK